jgi:hypothetical protein
MKVTCAEWQNIIFSWKTSVAMLVFCLIVISFFQADHLLGAVGLRAFYPICGSLILPLLIFSSIPLILPFWRWNTALVVSLLALPVSLAMLGIATLIGANFFIIFGLLNGLRISVYFGVFTCVLAVLAIEIILWRAKNTPTFILVLSKLTSIFITIGFFLLTVILIAAVGGLNSDTEFQAATLFDDNYYHLTVTYSPYMGDFLTLYACNSIGVFCNSIYQSPRDAYNGKFMSLLGSDDNLTLSILVDGTTVYTHHVQ